MDSEEITMCESRFYYITPDGKLTRVATLHQALDAARCEGIAWLDYYTTSRPKRNSPSLLIRSTSTRFPLRSAPI